MKNRRLQSVGGKSLSITLPKEWVEANNLNSGDKMSVYSQSSGALIIKPDDLIEKKMKALLDISGLSPEKLTREIIGIYISGFEEISLVGTIEAEQKQAVKQLAQMLIGFEIVEVSSNKIVFKNILDIHKFSTRETLNKIFRNAISMIEDVTIVALKNKRELANNIIERDSEVNKLHFSVSRQYYSLLRDNILEEDIGLDKLKMSYIRDVSIQLERIADHSAKIATALSDRNGKLDENISSFIAKTTSKILQSLKSASAIYDASDLPTAHLIIDSCEKIISSIEKFSPNYLNSPSLTIIFDSMKRICRYLINIAEYTIDMIIIDKVENKGVSN